jgi:PhnB protein
MAIQGGRSASRTVVPNLIVRDVDRALDFYRQVFGARVLYRSALPGGKALHAQAQVFDSVVLLSLENMGAPEDQWAQNEKGVRTRAPETLQGTSAVLELYVDDVDAVYRRAVEAGATSKIEPTDAFYGDRICQVVDPFGHVWGLATVKEILEAQTVDKRAAELFSSFSR